MIAPACCRAARPPSYRLTQAGPRPTLSSVPTSSHAPPIFLCGAQGFSTGLRDQLVVIRDAGDTNAAHAFVAIEERNAAGDGKAVRKHQPARSLLDPLLQRGARPLAEGRGACLQRGDLDAVWGLTIGALEIDEMPAAIDDGDGG